MMRSVYINMYYISLKNRFAIWKLMKKFVEKIEKVKWLKKSGACGNHALDSNTLFYLNWMEMNMFIFPYKLFSSSLQKKNL